MQVPERRQGFHETVNVSPPKVGAVVEVHKLVREKILEKSTGPQLAVIFTLPSSKPVYGVDYSMISEKRKEFDPPGAVGDIQGERIGECLRPPRAESWI
jgi:hypothetical protein